jgi:hypothetical protein
MTFRLLFFFATLSISFAVSAASPAIDAFAQPVLLGMQLSAKHGERRGEISTAENACVQALPPSSFYGVVEGVMSDALTPSELATTDRFFSTPVGQKYLKHGVLRIYPAVGERAPEALPEFSDSEYRQLEAFAATSAGNALITRQVMQSAAAKQGYGARIRELSEGCRAK